MSDTNTQLHLLHQTIFNQVATHLLTQKKRAVDEASAYRECQYRNAAGLKCAVGCLIKDEHYSTLFEGLVVRDQPVAEAVMKSLGIQELEDETIQFLRELQQLHDCTPVERWEKDLHDTAKFHGLTMPTIVAKEG